MKKILYTVICSTVVFAATAQVKVGNNPTTINASSVLEVESTNKGLLLPRVALSATTTPTLVGGAHVAGMTVYNTATAGDVTPGYYYNDGTKWVRLADANADWHITGNASTTPPTVVGTAVGANNYWGTNDAKNLAVGTNATTRAIFDQNGSLYGGSGTYDATIAPANSLVWGNTNIDSSKNSFVFGNNNVLSTGTLGGSTQTNRGTILGGGQNQVLGISYNSMINGSQNTLTGASFENIVDGFQNTLNGSQKMIVNGQGNTATGAVYGFLNGLNNSMTGGYGIVQGNLNSANADYGFALGSNNTINTGANFGVAFGSGNTVAANNANSWAIGTNATTTVASQYVSNFGGGYRLFTAANTSGTAAMVVTSAGNVGINTNAPTDLLSVNNNNINGKTITTGYNNQSPTIFMVPYLNTNGYDGMSTASDAGIFFASSTGAPITGTPSATRGFVIGPWFNNVTGSGILGLKVLENGNVGIGSATPTSALQVVGLSTYASDSAAGAAGLTTGAFFKDASGGVHVKL